MSTILGWWLEFASKLRIPCRRNNLKASLVKPSFGARPYVVMEVLSGQVPQDHAESQSDVSPWPFVLEVLWDIMCSETRRGPHSHHFVLLCFLHLCARKGIMDIHE